MYRILSDLARFPLCCLFALRLLLVDRRLLALCLVPLLLGVATFILVLYGMLSWRDGISSLLFSRSDGWLIDAGASVIAIIVASVVSLLVGVGAGSVFIESFAERIMRRCELVIPQSSGLRGELTRTARGVWEALKRTVAVGALLSLVAVTSLIPFLALPLLAVTAFLVGADVLDIPLSLQNYSFRERWRISVAHKGWCFAAGASLMAAAIVPFGALLLLPIVLAATVIRVSEWEKGSQKE
jgi:uncharacterized protein involved in cysteine biosynthesis